MTEAEWLACQNPGRMLLRSESKATMRKLRLFACACCRRIRHLLTDDRLRRMVEVAEGMADAVVEAAGEDFRAAQQAAFDALNTTTGAAARLAARAVIEAAFPACSPDLALRVAMTAKDAKYANDRITRRLEEHAQAGILYEIIGNPFRPVAVDPSWLTPGVVELARTIYEDRAFDRMPALADALEDAGCHDTDILAHCRQPGQHVRGCWVVDLLLGKVDGYDGARVVGLHRSEADAGVLARPNQRPEVAVVRSGMLPPHLALAK